MSKSAHIFDIKDALSKRAAMSGAIEVVSVAERADGLIVSVRLADGSEKAVFAKNEADFFEALDWANKRTVEGGSEVRDTSSERTAVVHGYTELGQLICDDLMARGITVIVVEASDPIAAMKAALAGCEVRLPGNAPTTSDIVIDCRSHGVRSGASESSDVATGAAIQRETVSDAGLSVFRDRAKSPDHYPREAAIVALVDRIGLPFEQAVFAYRELELLFEQKLAHESSDEIKQRVLINIDTIDDLTSAVRDFLKTNPDQAAAVQASVMAELDALSVGRFDQDRIAALWAAEIAKPKNDPTRRRPGPFIREMLAAELAVGMQRKDLPQKLSQAYAGWLKNNPDEEPIWPEVDRQGHSAHLAHMSAEEVLDRKRAQARDASRRYREKTLSK